MYFEQIKDEWLAQYAYLIGCQRTGEALLIDPMRDINRYIDRARSQRLKITAVSETHIHADFLSGTREFAEKTKAKIYLSDEGDADWKYEWAKNTGYNVEFLKDGDSFYVGNIRIDIQHTPGHTPEHISFLVTDEGGGATEPMGIITGDFVFVGDLGRPDLLESAAGYEGAMEPSAQRLYASVQNFIELPDYLQVWPGHGAGSACGKSLGAIPESTVGYEKRFNASILAASNGEGAFVDSILADQKAPPLYFGRMKKLNKEGPPVLGDIPDPEQLILEELKNYIGNSDYAILDTRMSRQQFFAGHIPGSMFTPLNPTFPTITGSYVDPDQKIILIIEENKVKDAVLGLIHIGLDNVIGWCDTGIIDEYAKSAGELGSIESIDWETFDERGGSNGSFLLDCRYDNEYEEGHVPDAYNIPHTRLAVRADELPRDRHVIIYCRTGSRASSAASYLKCHGFEVTHVDDLINRWFANNRV